MESWVAPAEQTLPNSPDNLNQPARPAVKPQHLLGSALSLGPGLAPQAQGSPEGEGGLQV